MLSYLHDTLPTKVVRHIDITQQYQGNILSIFSRNSEASPFSENIKEMFPRYCTDSDLLSASSNL